MVVLEVVVVDDVGVVVVDGVEVVVVEDVEVGVVDMMAPGVVAVVFVFDLVASHWSQLIAIGRFVVVVVPVGLGSGW